jgi:hypothetical protein
MPADNKGIFICLFVSALSGASVVTMAVPSVNLDGPLWWDVVDAMKLPCFWAPDSAWL